MIALLRKKGREGVRPDQASKRMGLRQTKQQANVLGTGVSVPVPHRPELYRDFHGNFLFGLWLRRTFEAVSPMW